MPSRHGRKVAHGTHLSLTMARRKDTQKSRTARPSVKVGHPFFLHSFGTEGAVDLNGRASAPAWRRDPPLLSFLVSGPRKTRPDTLTQPHSHTTLDLQTPPDIFSPCARRAVERSAPPDPRVTADVSVTDWSCSSPGLEPARPRPAFARVSWSMLCAATIRFTVHHTRQRLRVR